MVGYSPLQIRRQDILPGFAFVPPAPRRPAAALGQDEIPDSLVTTAGLVGLAVAGATAWVGINAGIKEKGLLSVAGWVVGVGGALRTLLIGAGLAAFAATPEPETPRQAMTSEGGLV